MSTEPQPVNDDGYLGIRLAQLANTVASDMPGDHSGVVVEACHLIRQLEELLAKQVAFTERLRSAATEAMAHANHINSNYCKGVPDDKMRAWAEAQVVFSAASITLSPAQAVSAVARDGAAIN